MINITVCIGSSCHIKGSRQVVEELQNLIAQNELKEKIELSGTFCMGRCEDGVCVKVDGDFYSVKRETLDEWFKTEVLPRIDK